MVSVVRFCASAATRAPVPYTARPAMKQTLRPQMSVSLLPGIISAAIVSVNSVMVVWIPVTEVSRSLAIVEIATFMLDPAKLQMNCASAKGRTRAPAAVVALTPAVRESVMIASPGQSWRRMRRSPSPGSHEAGFEPAAEPSSWFLRASPRSAERSHPRARALAQRGVEADRGVDHCEMRERLREVSDLLHGQGDRLRALAARV